ncbi:hypothetical protein NIES4073_42630 [Kalymmatonema gypsitolerans NIES-4073]|nr:hypothetical protein NIES4073_42630 [Scytonema sp. NIES-4073]
MADIERLNYFNNQFLKEEDFLDEQKYHLEMRRHHNRLLHTPGIAEGLEIRKTGAKEVKVTRGSAIDSNGREMILLDDLNVPLSDQAKYPPNSTIYITITYEEKKPDDSLKWQPSEEKDKADSKQFTRWVEKPKIVATTTEPDSTVIKLARFKLDANGNVPGDINAELDDGVRQKATAKLPTFSISIQQLKTQVVAQSSTQPIKMLKSSETKEILAYQNSLSSTTKNIGAFLLVYGYSKTKDTEFTWEQIYKTEQTDKDKELMYKQFVKFSNTGGKTIEELEYIIYAVLEN